MKKLQIKIKIKDFMGTLVWSQKGKSTFNYNNHGDINYS